MKIKNISKKLEGILNSLRNNPEKYHGQAYDNTIQSELDQKNFITGYNIVMIPLSISIIAMHINGYGNWLEIAGLILLSIIYFNHENHKYKTTKAKIKPFIFMNPCHFIYVDALCVFRHKIENITDIQDFDDVLVICFGSKKYHLVFDSSEEAQKFASKFNEQQELLENSEFEGNDFIFKGMNDLSIEKITLLDF